MRTESVRICFPFTGDVVGGSHFSVLGLVRNLDPARYVPVIVPQYADGAIAGLFRDHGLNVETPLRWAEMSYDTTVRLWDGLRVVRGMAPQMRYLRSNRFRIVHTNDGRTHATWALAARLAGAKLLWHQRGDPGAVGLRLVAPLLANQVVSVSRFALPRPGLWSAAAKARVVHSAFATDIRVDRAAARAELVAELGCPADTLLVGYFGAFIPRKRPHLFIDTIGTLVGRRLSRPVLGLMFGEAYDEGRTEQALASYADDRKLGGTVRQMGFRTPGPRWLAACDVLLVPAVGEPFGRTLIEAMLVGTPVVATASGGNIEALRDGTIGILVPPENAAALADGVGLLLERPEWAAALAAAAQKDARSRFGEAMHASQIMAIYDEMLGRGRTFTSASSSTVPAVFGEPAGSQGEVVS